MNVLLVVDIEHEYGWGADITEYNIFETKIANNLKAVLANFRRDGIEIIFIMFPFFNGYGYSLAPKYQLVRAHLPTNWEDWITTFPLRYKFKRPLNCLACENPHPMAPFLEHCHDPFEPVFFKNTMDAFGNPELIKYLRNRNVKSIGIAGCSTTACVQKTACGAMKNGLSVELLRDCIRPPFNNQDAERIWLNEVWTEVHRECRTVSIEII